MSQPRDYNLPPLAQHERVIGRLSARQQAMYASIEDRFVCARNRATAEYTAPPNKRRRIRRSLIRLIVNTLDEIEAFRDMLHPSWPSATGNPVTISLRKDWQVVRLQGKRVPLLGMQLESAPFVNVFDSEYAALSAMLQLAIEAPLPALPVIPKMPRTRSEPSPEKISRHNQRKAQWEAAGCPMGAAHKYWISAGRPDNWTTLQAATKETLSASPETSSEPAPST